MTISYRKPRGSSRDTCSVDANSRLSAAGGARDTLTQNGCLQTVMSVADLGVYRFEFHHRAAARHRKHGCRCGVCTSGGLPPTSRKRAQDCDLAPTRSLARHEKGEKPDCRCGPSYLRRTTRANAQRARCPGPTLRHAPSRCVPLQARWIFRFRRAQPCTARAKKRGRKDGPLSTSFAQLYTSLAAQLCSTAPPSSPS